MKNGCKNALIALAMVAVSSIACADIVYDATVTPLPGNLPSEGAEAYAFAEIGDGITLAGTARHLRSVTVTMSSWACKTGAWNLGNCVTPPGSTFSVDITLNVYQAGAPTPGALLATQTQTFTIPYRPSADPSCTGGRWKQASTGTCFNGLAYNITFNMAPQNVTLPNSVVYGISYNTSHYGPAPIGESPSCYTTVAGCPYDSLNVALSPAVVTGSKSYPDTVYQNSSIGGEYCDGGAAGTGSFRLDSPTSACWAGYVPAAKVDTFNIATSKDACKGNGWQSLARANGTTFSNQGDCVSYTNNGK